MPFPQITPLGTPPSRNNPATFRSLMDTRLAEQNTMVTEINAFGAALNSYTASGVPWAYAGGTANALTITLPERDAALTRMFFFAPSLENTSTTVTINLNGEGARPVKTPTLSNPPVGYFGNGVMGNGILPFVAIRSGSEWIVRRQDERGNNANGEYWKLGSGLLICVSPTLFHDVTTAVGGVFTSVQQTWTLPAEFTSGATVTGTGATNDVYSWVSVNPSTTQALYAILRASSATGRSARLTCMGRWF